MTVSEDIVKRLEAAVARIESFMPGHHGAAATSSSSAGSSSSSSGSESQAYSAWQQYYQSSVVPFIAAADAQPETKQIAEQTRVAFTRTGQLIQATSSCTKPSDADLIGYLQPVVDVITKSASACDNRSPFFPHQKAFAETASALSFVTQPAPKPFVQGQLEAADFYLIKVLTAGKQAGGAQGDKHIAYGSTLKALLKDMIQFIDDADLKQGLTWNAKGTTTLKSFNPTTTARASVSSSGAPPPPPPGGPMSSADLHAAAPKAAAAPAAGGLGAVFDSIRGADVTSGLKKVTKEMKTKYQTDVPALQPKLAAAAGAVGSAASSAVGAAKSAVGIKSAAPKAEAKIYESKGTWFVENYEGGNVTVPDVEIKQNVYILKCKNTSISIPNKCKSIQVDSCNRVQVEFSSIVSIFEIFNSQRVHIHAGEACPSVAIDKSGGCQIHLSRKAVASPPQLITSSVTELNLVVPGATDNDDPIEIPLPEQYITVYKDGKISTEAVAHSAN